MTIRFNRIRRLLFTVAATSVMAIAGTCSAFELVAVPQAVVVDDAAANAIEQQLRAQVEPMLKVELSFVNRVCNLSDDERKVIITKSKEWFTTFLKDYAKNGGQGRMQGVWFGGPQPQAPDPREGIQKGVGKIVETELSKEQIAAYFAECKQRTEFEKRVSVDNLVTKIDKELILSPEQREKITKSLNEHWDDKWARQVEMFMHGMDMWPNVPDQWIRPHLTATQQVAWGRIAKHHGNVFFGGMGVNGQVIDDIDLDEGEEKPKADAAAQPNAAVQLFDLAVPQ
jgi:hypothetical protein